jgi:predicted nucleic acid-binding Zn ribbon protein
MSSEILNCHRCGEEFELYYSFRDECQVVSGHCKCSLQVKKDKVLDEALLKLKEVLNEELKPSTRKVSRQS